MDKSVYKRALREKNEDDIKIIELEGKKNMNMQSLVIKQIGLGNKIQLMILRNGRNIEILKDYLAPLKDKNKDLAWSSQRPQLESLFLQWSDRQRLQLVMEQFAVDKNKQMGSQHTDKGRDTKIGKE